MDDGEREGAQNMDARGKSCLHDSAMAFTRGCREKHLPCYWAGLTE